MARIPWAGRLLCVLLCIAAAMPASAAARSMLDPHAVGELQTGPDLTSPASCTTTCTVNLQPNAEAPFAVDGTGTWGDAIRTLTVTWNWGDGTPATVDMPMTSGNTYADNTSHVYTTPGTYTLTVTVTDPFDGSSLSNSFTIVVGTPPQVQLSLSASQANPIVGEPVTYTANATGTSTTPCSTCTYSFSTIDPSGNSGPSQQTSSSNTFTVSFPTPGAWRVIATVNDPVNGTATTSSAVTVSPVLDGSISGPTTALAGQNVTFTATASGGFTNQTGYTYAWRFDGTPVAASGSTASGTFTAGTHTITVTISDDAAPAHTVTRTLTLQVDPALVASFTVTPASGATAGSSVSFDASGTTGGRPPLTYAWDFGTGTFTGSGQTTTHTFATAGTYVVRLQVTDALGRTATTTRTVTVGCLKTLTFPLAQATTDGCFNLNTDGTYSTSSGISLNGIPFPAPASGHSIVLTPPSSAHPGGQLNDNSVTISLDGFNVYSGAVAWNLPADNASHSGTVATLTVPANTTVKGLRVIGSIALVIGKDTSGTYYASFPLHIQLPAAFKSGPSGGAASVTGDASLRVDKNGIHYDGLKVQVANAWVGDLQVKQVCFSFVPGGASGAVSPCSIPTLGGQPFIQCGSSATANRWDGNAEVVLPTPTRATVALFGGLSNGSLANLGGFADNLGTSVPIADGVFLTRVGFGLCLSPPPLQLKGVVGLSAGGSSALTVNGSFDFIDTNPWSLNLTGEISASSIDLGGGSLTIFSSGLFTFEVHSNFTLVKIIHVDGSIAGWVLARPFAFSLDGHIHACISSVCASAEAVLSTVGVAGCLSLGSFTYYTLARNHNWHWYAPWRVHSVAHTVHIETGFGYRWHASSARLFGGSCDLGDYQARLAAASARATFAVPAGSPAIAIRLTGAGGAPVVSLRAPNGKVIAPPSSGSSGRLPGGGLYVENPADDSTSIFVLHPAPGRWRVIRAASSVSVTGVELATTQRRGTAIGGVTAVGRGRYALGLAFALPRGETMRLFVRGPHNREQALGRAVGRRCPQNAGVRGVPSQTLCQNLKFTPLPGPAGVRTVIGLVYRHGMPQSTLTIASFRLKKSLLPRAPKVKLVRKSGGVAASWTRIAGARNYVVSVAVGDGRVLSLTATHPSTFVSRVGRGLSVRVQVWAMERDGVVGRPGVASLR